MKKIGEEEKPVTPDVLRQADAIMHTISIWMS